MRAGTTAQLGWPEFVPDKSFPLLGVCSASEKHNEESMIKIIPTVGRVVLFTPSRLTGDGRFAHIDGRKPLAAIVAHVFNDVGEPGRFR